MEHEHMRELMQAMATAMAETNQDRYLGLSETLNMLIQQHNLKEENMLYPMSDQVLGGESDSLIHAMQAITSERDCIDCLRQRNTHRCTLARTAGTDGKGHGHAVPAASRTIDPDAAAP